MQLKKLFRYSIISIVFLMACTNQTKDTLNENIDKRSPENDSLIYEVARDIMRKAPNCALITVDGYNQPRVREMDAFEPEKDFTVWFGTNPNSRKVSQIRNNANVTLYYVAKNNEGYVSLQGVAELINDEDLKQKYWKEEWTDFYPNQKEDYLLIKVTPKKMEVVSYPHKLLGETTTWEPPSVLFEK
ncbi:general stress protein 26 [Balneicella halophila]|uniref:General stress protein 26 n=2 Tax=Balneicella halophila TaxID=1537566 RepID=A0A7L4URM9_BALHA|nr:general stress protein 26 [Balneicella halophila]